MEPVWNTEIDDLLRVGTYLEELGVRNWALAREDALQALQRFSSLGVAVLGGDVYVKRDSGIVASYDSWYCSINPLETNSEFVRRSVDAAKVYITNYPAQTSEVLFSIVPQWPPE